MSSAMNSKTTSSLNMGQMVALSGQKVKTGKLAPSPAMARVPSFPVFSSLPESSMLTCLCQGSLNKSNLR